MERDHINEMHLTNNDGDRQSDKISLNDNIDILGQGKRNYINVIRATRNNVNGTSDETSQNLQENDNLLETNSDDDNVNIDNELRPTRHPGGISEETVNLKKVLSKKELIHYLVKELDLENKPALKENPKRLKVVKKMIYKHQKTFFIPKLCN